MGSISVAGGPSAAESPDEQLVQADGTVTQLDGTGVPVELEAKPAEEWDVPANSDEDDRTAAQVDADVARSSLAPPRVGKAKAGANDAKVETGK